MGYIILAIIILVIIVLLVSPISILVGFDKELSIIIKYLFFKLDLMEEDKEPKKEKEKPEKEEKKKDKLELSTIQAAYSAFEKVIGNLSKKTVKVLKKISINKLDLYLRVSGNDPYDIGKLYGNVNILVYLIYSTLTKIFKVNEKKTSIIINPDFEDRGWDYHINTIIKIRLASLLRYALTAGIDLFRAYLTFDKEMKKAINHDKNEVSK